MASPRGSFNVTSDGWEVVKSLIMAILSAAITWLMTDGLQILQQYLSPVIFPLVFAVLETIQKWVSDTRGE